MAAVTALGADGAPPAKAAADSETVEDLSHSAAVLSRKVSHLKLESGAAMPRICRLRVRRLELLSSPKTTYFTLSLRMQSRKKPKLLSNPIIPPAKQGSSMTVALDVCFELGYVHSMKPSASNRARLSLQRKGRRTFALVLVDMNEVLQRPFSGQLLLYTANSSPVPVARVDASISSLPLSLEGGSTEGKESDSDSSDSDSDPEEVLPVLLTADADATGIRSRVGRGLRDIASTFETGLIALASRVKPSRSKDDGSVVVDRRVEEAELFSMPSRFHDQLSAIVDEAAEPAAAVLLLDSSKWKGRRWEQWLLSEGCPSAWRGRFIATHNAREVQTALRELFVLSERPGAPAILPLLLCGSDDYVSAFVRAHEALLSRKPRGWQAFRFFLVPMSRHCALASSLAAIDPAYAALFVQTERDGGRGWRELWTRETMTDREGAHMDSIINDYLAAEGRWDVPVSTASLRFHSRTEQRKMTLPFLTRLLIGLVGSDNSLLDARVGYWKLHSAGERGAVGSGEYSAIAEEAARRLLAEAEDGNADSTMPPPAFPVGDDADVVPPPIPPPVCHSPSGSVDLDADFLASLDSSAASMMDDWLASASAAPVTPPPTSALSSDVAATVSSGGAAGAAGEAWGDADVGDEGDAAVKRINVRSKRCGLQVVCMAPQLGKPAEELLATEETAARFSLQAYSPALARHPRRRERTGLAAIPTYTDWVPPLRGVPNADWYRADSSKAVCSCEGGFNLYVDGVLYRDVVSLSVVPQWDGSHVCSFPVACFL